MFGFWEKKLKYRVRAVRNLAWDIIDITLAPQEKKLKYKAGQYVFLSFRNAKIGPEEHPFSLASAPDDHNLRIVIKTIGDYVQNLKDLSVGSLAVVRGPRGKFSFFNFKNKNQIWIAGGIGITPFISMSKVLDKYPRHRVILFYCANTEADLILINELKATAAANHNFRVVSFCADKQGIITAADIKKVAGEVKNKEILLSGPPPMISALREQFGDLGVPENNFHTDD